jgi:hypothetical protein
LAVLAVILFMAVTAQAQSLEIKLVPQLKFAGTPFTIYALEFKTNLNEPSWHSLSFFPPLGPLGGTITTTDDSNGENRIYRLRRVGIEGNLALSLDDSPADGAIVQNGTDTEVASYLVQAGRASEMTFTSLALDFDKRVWLYADSITVWNGSTVVAHKSDLNANDFVELSVGASYRMVLPTGYVLATNDIAHLTVTIHGSTVSDRASSPISLTRAQLRAVDFQGVVDTETTDAHRIFQYKRAVGQVIATLDASSPLANLIPISSAAQTHNVLLGRFDVKVQNISGFFRNLQLYIHTENASFDALFSDVKIAVNGHTYSQDGSVSKDSAYDAWSLFSNMNEVLPADQVIPVSVYGDIKQDVNHILSGAKATVSLVTSTSTTSGGLNNPEVEDGAYEPIAVIPTTLTASTLTFSSSSATLSGLSATLGSTVVVNNTTVAQRVTFTVTVEAGADTLYVSANPALALNWTATGLPAQSSTSVNEMTPYPGSISGDSNGNYYVVPAGSSRVFTFTGIIDNIGGTHGTKTMSITAVKYGTSSSAPTANTINYRLEALKVTTTL